MSYSFLREKRFLYGSHGGYFTGVGAGSSQPFRSERQSYLFESKFVVPNHDDDNASEEEWRRIFEAGNLLEKAVDLVRQGYRYPKPMYEYSPEGSSPEPYEVPYGTVLLPNPSPPRDREGRLVRDPGSEVPFHSSKSIIDLDDGPSVRRMVKNKNVEKVKKAKYMSKSLQSLREIDESPSPLERTPIRSRIASQMSKDEGGKSDKSDAESKGTEGKENRKPATALRETALLSDDTDTSRAARATSTAPLTTLHNDSKNASADDSDSSKNITRSVYSNRERFKTRSERLKEARSTNDLSDERSFRSESVFGNYKDKEKRSAPDEDDNDYGYRRPSFLSSLHNTSLAQLNETQPKSTCDYLQERLNRLEGKSDPQKTEPEKSPERTFRRGLIYTNAELQRMAQSKEESKDQETKSSDGKDEKGKPASEEKQQEYIPSKRIPLKQRLKNKMSSTSTDVSELSSTDTDADVTNGVGGHPGHTAPFNTPLVGRHAPPTTTQDESQKSSKKEDSLKSRLLKKFHIGSEDKKDDRKESKDRKSRKKNDSESSHDERKEKSRETRSETVLSKYEPPKPSAYDTYSNRALMMSMDHRLSSIDINMDTIYKTGTSLAEILVKEEEKAGVDMSRYHAYSPEVKKKFIERKSSTASSIGSEKRFNERFDTSESNNEQDSISRSPKRSRRRDKDAKRSSDEDHRSPRKSRRNRRDSNKDSEDDINTSKSPRRSRKPTENDLAEETDSPTMSIRDRDKNYLKEPESEFKRDDVPSPKGTSRRIHHNMYSAEGKKRWDMLDDSSDSDNENTKRHRVFEDPIRPLVKKADSFKIDFRSPRRSVHEHVVEDITSVQFEDQPLRDDIFNVLLQREVSVESLHILCRGDDEEEERRLSKLFERMSRLSFDSYRASSELSDRSASSSVGELARSIRTSIASLNDQTVNIGDKVDKEVRETVLCGADYADATCAQQNPAYSSSDTKRRPDSGSSITLNISSEGGVATITHNNDTSIATTGSPDNQENAQDAGTCSATGDTHGEDNDTNHEQNKLDSSPFKLLKKTEGKSFDNAVEETKKDVNKMIIKCNSIDKINKDITNGEVSPSKTPEKKSEKEITVKPTPTTAANVPGTVTSVDTGGVQLRLKKREGADSMTLAQKRHSLVERRLALLQREQAVESRKTQRPKSMGSISKSLFENGYTVTKPISLSSEPSRPLSMTIKLNITPGEKSESSAGLESGSADNSKAVKLNRSASNIVPTQSSTQNSEVRTGGEVHRSDSEPSSTKSLSDIKSRINAIKARREQLSKIAGGAKKDSVVITEMADI